MKVLVCIPCYNCAPQISRILEKLQSSKVVSIADILIVDNCSVDDTREKIMSSLASIQMPIRNKFKFIKHKKNYGLGGTFKTFYENALNKSYDYIALFHGDDQASIQDLETMIDMTLTEQIDCIFGARFKPPTRLHNYSKVREIGNRLINLIYSIFLRKPIYEIGSGLNVYRVSSLPGDEIPFYPDHIAFDINLLFHFLGKKTNYKTKFHSIAWYEADQKSNADNLKVGAQVLIMLGRYLLKRSNLTGEVSAREYEEFAQ